MAADAGFTTITANRFVDASNFLIPSFQLVCIPTDDDGTPISVHLTNRGQILPLPVIFSGTAGAINPPGTGLKNQLVDVSQSSPAFFRYRVTLINTLTQKVLAQFTAVQPQGPTFNFDTYDPATVPQEIDYTPATS